MKTKTIRTLYKIGIILAVVVFAAMMWDYFQNESELIQPLALAAAVIVLWLLIMLLLSPYDVDVRVERVQVKQVVGAPGKTKPVDHDFIGQVHEVVDLEGVGGTYARKLHAMGIENTQELLFADSKAIAAETGASPKTVANWKAMSQLIKVNGIGPQYAEALVRAGIDGIEELRDEPAAAIAGAVTGYLDSLESNVIGQKVTAKRVASWQKAARKLEHGKIDLSKIKVKPLESKAAKADAA